MSPTTDKTLDWELRELFANDAIPSSNPDLITRLRSQLDGEAPLSGRARNLVAISWAVIAVISTLILVRVANTIELSNTAWALGLTVAVLVSPLLASRVRSEGVMT